MQFGINYTRKVSNFTRLRLVKLQTLLVQLIPNCTASHGITYTNFKYGSDFARNYSCGNISVVNLIREIRDNSLGFDQNMVDI